MGDGPPSQGRSGRGGILKLSSYLNVELRRVGDAAVVAARGEIDLSTLAKIAAALDGARAGVDLLILDLRGVDFMDTSGLRLVIEQQRRAAEGGYRFAVVPGPPRVQRLLEIAGLAGLDELFIEAPPQSAGGDRG